MKGDRQVGIPPLSETSDTSLLIIQSLFEGDSSMKTLIIHSETFQFECTRYHCKRACRSAIVNSNKRKGHRELSPISLCRQLLVLAVIEARFARRIDDNDESENEWRLIGRHVILSL